MNILIIIILNIASIILLGGIMLDHLIDSKINKMKSEDSRLEEIKEVWNSTQEYKKFDIRVFTLYIATIGVIGLPILITLHIAEYMEKGIKINCPENYCEEDCEKCDKYEECRSSCEDCNEYDECYKDCCNEDCINCDEGCECKDCNKDCNLCE